MLLHKGFGVSLFAPSQEYRGVEEGFASSGTENYSKKLE